MVEISTAFLLRMLLDVSISGDASDLVSMIIYTVVILFLLFVLTKLKNRYKNSFLKKAMIQYKEEIFIKLFDKEVNTFQEHSSTDYISAISNDLNIIESNYLNGNITLVNQAVLLILALASMIYLSIFMTVIVLFVSIIPTIIVRSFGAKIVKIEKKVSANNATFLSRIDDFLTGFTVIKTNLAEKQILQYIVSENNALESEKEFRRNKGDSLHLYGSMLGIMVSFIIVITGAFLTINGRETAGIVIAFIQLLNSVNTPLQSFSPLLANKKAAEALIDKAISSVRSNTPNKFKKHDITFNDAITLENITLSYGKKKIFNRLNLRFEKGKSYAIIGESGVGKSSLINLIMKQNTNYEGEIKIDGTSLREISDEGMHGVVSIVPQHIKIFNCSIKDNITLFKTISDADIEQVIKDTNLSKLVNEKGLEHMCGIGGSNLSGGEKQRIALARALIRKTPILIIDEGTSALDKKIAEEIEKTILNLDSLTRIVITHKTDSCIMQEFDNIIDLGNTEHMLLPNTN